MSLMDPLVSDEHTAKPRRNLILIVEGDFLTRWTAAEYLRETGFDVIEAVNSAEALAALRAGAAFDAVFCDLASMSDSAGPELLDWLEKRPALPVILVSDVSDHSATQPAIQMRSSIAKPYAMSEVEQRLHTLLGAR
jgi:CheY-like chemotaxis protein